MPSKPELDGEYDGVIPYTNTDGGDVLKDQYLKMANEAHSNPYITWAQYHSFVIVLYRLQCVAENKQHEM